MKFKKGFKVKPKEIRSNGVVIFTDGTNDVSPSELACKAYGYEFNEGVCKAYIPSKVLDKTRTNNSTVVQGGENKTSKNVSVSVLGEGNELFRVSNSLVVGDRNKINENVSNSIVGGTLGNSRHLNELCIGGGSFEQGTPGLTQYSVLQVSNKTTSTTDVHLNLESSSTGTEITLPANSVTTYEIWLSGLVSGGSSGTAGDYETYEYHGTIRTSNNGTMTHNAKISRLLGRTGSLGTQTIDTSTPFTLSVIVTGQENVNCQWHAVVKLHINRTVASTF
tara:strand:+ start:611 stop:1444 length:834 start_codon:yes stop_codon:yes gene_type:complete